MLSGKYKIAGMQKEGYKILEAKLNSNVVYKAQEEFQSPYYVEYTVDTTQNKALNYTYASGSNTYYLGLPVLGDITTSPDINYEKVEITLNDGTITDDLSTTMNNISKVKIWYPESTTTLKFRGYSSSYPNYIKTLSYAKTDNFDDMSYMFNNCSSLISLDLSIFNTSKVTNMSNMFQDCSSLTSLDLSNFDTSNVTRMFYMFRVCESLTSLDLSNWDTSKVTDMDSMFCYCPSLTSLDISNFNTNKVTNMSNMFQDCSSLTSLDLSNFDTSNVTDMRAMFYKCSSLTSLDLSNFNTSKVTDMYSMFDSCSSLTSLDISNFNTSKVTDMSGMFKSVPTTVDWHYNENNYTNWTLSESNTGYSGKFPWHIIIDFTQSTTMPTLPSWISLYTKGSSYYFSQGTYSSGVYGLIPNNKGVANSVAWNCYKIVAPANKKIKITYRCYTGSEDDYDYLTAHLTATSSQPSYSSSTNQIFTTKGVTKYQTTDGTATYSTTLSSGGVYYLHIQYRKDSMGDSGYDMGVIRKIELV